ncbi:hypothetical protein [Streptomyces varsoviensis]|uniref:Uncharacterized protein n=1 Tax=Streptomyces varsoviensis TaxID=67373 RepID=A0ABR5J054_9ACTN|nr:hypothetical protein [Streptomyces varsoviensis]KOG86802.1 hypothetical protein ADK38_29015 [Streptomyces varsoviensis]
MARTRPFPRDLLQIQRDWNTAYTALATTRQDTATLRRRLLHLSTALRRHPFWTAAPAPAPAARAELRRLARSEEREAGNL